MTLKLHGGAKKPIFEIGDVLGIPSSELVPFGHDKAKISQNFINSVKNNAMVN